MTDGWNLGFPRYLIEDGAYREVSCGQTLHTFAIEFFADKRLKASREAHKQAVLSHDYHYNVVAQVMFVSGKTCVIDFGLKAVRYTDLLPKRVKARDFVKGTVYVGVPLCIEVVPQSLLATLSYDWRVDRIFADATPYIERRGLLPGSQTCRVRDRRRIQYNEVDSTARIRTEHYVLKCRLVPRD